MNPLQLHKKAGFSWFYAHLKLLDQPNAQRIATAAWQTLLCLADNGKRGLKAHTDLLRLEERWYASFVAGKPDYGVYSEDVYLAEVWACWDYYSRKYIMDITAEQLRLPELMGDGCVLDLGNGIGLTSATFAHLFPLREVYATNLRGTTQWRFNELVQAEHRYTLLEETELHSLPPVALCFASEYFEHYEAPIEQLQKILALRPRILVTANAFGADSIGHFPEYILEGERIPNTAIGKHFGLALREAGYTPVITGFWNNRPAVYKLST